MCPVCEQQSSSEAALMEHLKSHQEDGVLENFAEQVFICPDCGEFFLRLILLKIHHRNAHRGPVSKEHPGANGEEHPGANRQHESTQEQTQKEL